MPFVIKNCADKSSTFINIVVYGDYGVGKTYLATTDAREGHKVLIISIEDGELSVTNHPSAKYIDSISIKTNKEASELIKEIKEDKDGRFKDYAWIFFDTMTEFGHNIYYPLKTKMDIEAVQSGNKGSHGMQVWGEFARLIGEVTKQLRSLNKHTCIICHDGEKEVEGIHKTTVDIYGQSSSRIVGWIDEVFYMTFNDKGERILRTKGTNRFVAKDRSGQLNDVEKPCLKTIREKILS